MFRNLAEKKGIKLNFEQVSIEDVQVVMYRPKFTGYCPFYNLYTKSCEIHEIKPLTCKLYPILIDVKSRQVVVSLDCSWVKETIEKFGTISLDMFTEVELNALKEIVRRLWNYDVTIEY